jgi:hypothetical protein
MNWKPPIDIKRVIIHELGAVLAKVSGDTLMVGPKGKKNKSFRSADAYVKRRYTWPKRPKRKGAKSKLTPDTIPVLQIGRKKYYSRNFYRAGTWGMIQKKLAELRKEAKAATGSSKAAWFLMFKEAQKASGVKAPNPSTWKDVERLATVVQYMRRRSRSWAMATSSTDKSGERGDFVLQVFTKAHNTLNPGTKGASTFQKYLNGRQGYMERVMGKKMEQSMEKILKKYPGLATS